MDKCNCKNKTLNRIYGKVINGKHEYTVICNECSKIKEKGSKNL